MRTESIVNRPFFGMPEGSDQLLDGAAIRFDSSEVFQVSGAARVSIAPADADLEIQLSAESLDQLADWPDLDDWNLCVTLADDTRRKVSVLLHQPVSSIPDDGILQVGSVRKPLTWAGAGGASLFLMVVLNKDRPSVPGLPFRLGHIAASKRWSINHSASGADFEVAYWSREQFAHERYPANSTVIVHGDGDGLLNSDSGDFGIMIAVSDRLRGAFAHARRTKQNNALQDEIKCQAIAQLLCLLKEQRSLPDGSRAAKLVERILGAEGSQAVLASLSTQNLFGLAQAYVKLNEAMSKAVL